VGLRFVDLVAGEDIKYKGFSLIHGLSQAGSRMVPSGAKRAVQIFFDSLVNSLVGEGVKTQIKEVLLTECSAPWSVCPTAFLILTVAFAPTSLLHQERAHHSGLILRESLSARRQELQQK